MANFLVKCRVSRIFPMTPVTYPHTVLAAYLKLARITYPCRDRWTRSNQYAIAFLRGSSTTPEAPVAAVPFPATDTRLSFILEVVRSRPPSSTNLPVVGSSMCAHIGRAYRHSRTPTAEVLYLGMVARSSSFQGGPGREPGAVRDRKSFLGWVLSLLNKHFGSSRYGS